MWDRASLTSLVSVGLAVLAYLWYQSPLQSSRPFPAEESNLRSNFVDARPWEDPLEAVESHDRSEAGAKRAPHHPFGLERPPESAVAFLLVLTNGRPYPEGHETRLDDRYAVGSALAVACYIATGKDPLDFFTWPNSGEKNLLTSKQPLKVPFEWYKRRAAPECAGGAAFEQVLVIWLNNEEFGTQPLKAISNLTKDLCESPIRQVSSCRTIPFKIIGPGDSDTYERMIEEVATYDGFSWAGQRVELYSPRATRSDWFISPFIRARLGVDPSKRLEDVLSSAFRDDKIGLEYQIAQDVQVFTSLIEELERRNIDPTGDSIALVSELDTKYGRALPVEFAAAACASKSGLARKDSKQEGLKSESCAALLRDTHQGQELKRDGQAWSLQALDIIRANPKSIQNLTEYSYVRGLDGLTINKLGRKTKSGGDGNGAPSKNKERERFPWELSTEYLERPAGESQYDYVRRLVERIKKDENGSPRPVKAIGVLGTDIFDKLLILEALRKDFPGTVFFTTDLEAWLFDESQHEWTRNLVVASAFGLELDAALQKNVPPFRSSYQTSTFFATLRALGHVQKKPACTGAAQGSPRQLECYRIIGSDKNYEATIVPKLFEVGRNGPVDITVESAGPATVHPTRPDLIPRFVMPSFPGFLPSSFFRYVLLVIFFGAICFIFIVPHLLQGARRGSAFILRLAALAALFVLILNHLWGRYEPYVGFPIMTLISSAFAIGLLILTLPQMFQGAFRHPALLPKIVLSGTALWVAVLAVVWLDAQSGEPFSLWDGVSTWPTIVLRLIVIVLVVYFFRAASVAIRESDDTLIPRHIRQSWRRAGFWDRAAWIFRDPQQIDRAIATDEVQVVQREYLQAGESLHRVGRIVILFVMYVGFVGLLFLVDGLPPTPCRGVWNCRFETVTLGLSVFGLVLLNLYVFDATQLCRTFIDNLIGPPKPGVTADRYRDVIRLIENRTATIGPLVYYPFIALALMIVSRYRFFDNWIFPWPLIAAWFLNAALVFWSAYMLKQAAERARARAVEHLNELLVSPAAAPAQIPVLLDAIKTTRKGSFDHIMQQPAVSSSLIAILAALQYYFTK